MTQKYIERGDVYTEGMVGTATLVEYVDEEGAFSAGAGSGLY